MVDMGRAKGSLLREVRRVYSMGAVGGLTDGELVERFVSGRNESSEAAFEELMHRHGPMVLRVCRGMLGDRLASEDAFQATFLVLAQRAGSIRRRESVSGWLFGVARRVAAHARSRAARRRSSERLFAQHTPEAVVPEESAEERDALFEELEGLSERLRGVVVLCCLQGLTYDAAGQRLGLSQSAVRGRLARARGRLRRRLARRGILIPAALFAVGSGAQVCAGEPLEVAAALVDSTTRLAFGLKAGVAARSLARGVIRSMLVPKLRAAVVVIAAGLGGSLLAWQTLAARNDEGGRAAARNEAQTRSPEAAADAKRQVGSSSGPSQPYTATIDVRDLATGAPIGDAHIECLSEGGATISATTDSSGRSLVTIPHLGRSYYLRVKASREGLVPGVISWMRQSGAPSPPARFRFQMEKAVSIGGRVVDQDQRPVPGASVVISVRKEYADSQQKADLFFVRTKTDAEGRWSFSNVPERVDAIAIGTYHHLYLPAEDWFRIDDFEPLSALRDRSAVLGLKKGTRIDGTVVGPDGRPVPDAAVVYGMESLSTGNRIPPIQTDSQGRFTIGSAPGTIVLTARRAGFGPALETVEVASEPARITLTLQPPRTIEGRVVDQTGLPIAGANLTVRTWRRSAAIEHEVATDADGLFVVKDAPSDEVRVQAYAEGYLRKGDIPLVPGTLNQIVLASPTTVKGKVVDAQTGQPIQRFSLVHGTVWNAEGRFSWQENHRADEEAVKSPGSFKWTFMEQVDRLAVRVAAEGYISADSGLFAQDGAVHEFTFRLSKAEPIRGTVLCPDGSPATEGFVYLAAAGEVHELDPGNVPRRERERMTHTAIARGGVFSLPSQTQSFLLLALADAGYGMVRQKDFPRNEVIRLEPWARVSGTVRIGTKPASNIRLRVQPVDDESRSSDDEPTVFRVIDFTTDGDGRFNLPRLMTGRYDIIRPVPNGVNPLLEVGRLDVTGGRSYELTLGGNGRPVSGRLVLPANLLRKWMVRRAAITPTSGPAEPRPRGVEIMADGRFRADDIESGEYNLGVTIHEPPPEGRCGFGRLVGEFTRTFTVPPIPGGVSDDPLDLGNLEPAPVTARSLAVGDRAPDFAVMTWDGRELQLADLKGKFVIIDFWATWCAPCIAELPNLRTIYDTYSADRRFAMVSLSLDEQPADLESFMRSRKFPWANALIGPNSPIAAAYDATAIPATFLVGPDGRILAKDLRGERAIMTVREALKR
jgi:RNA polymerase sigma factor (sigma-70 family)